MKLIVTVIYVFLMFFFINENYNSEFENEFERSMYEYNRNTNIDINDDFEDDKAIIVFKSKYSIKGRKVNDKENNNFLNYINNLKYENNSLEIESIDDILLVEDNDITKRISYFNQIVEIKLVNHNKEAVVKLCNEAKKHKYVLSAEPSYTFKIDENSVSVNDTYYNEQWGLNNNHGIKIESAWNIIGYGNSNLKVGIFENSLEANHSDITANLFVEQDDFTMAHGTHVGGIIGAIKNNSGVIGVSQSTINVFKPNSFIGTLGSAINNGIRIINASIGFELQYSNIIYYKSAIKTYGTNGGLIIAAAGNDGVNIDNNPIYPASFANNSLYSDVNNVISVGALNSNGNRSSISNYGLNSVTIYAPGENILSTYPTSSCQNYGFEISGSNGIKLCELDEGELQTLYSEYIENGSHSWEDLAENYFEITNDTTLNVCSTHKSNGYHYMSGTSMAAPFVTGVAALLLSIDSSFTVAQIRDSIINGADDISINVPGSTTSQNVKKLNAFGAIKYALEHYLTITTYNISNGFTTTDYKNITSGIICTQCQGH